eukprot:CAMPEP_0172386134 /NCGR_PEP_ID=MMETSP1061-20121228/3733_1 /TAXON_ID=37318 /ORGANISM="Pseudo-nitzschia pungens, Strain cf. pungens" /LENGTH=447 /DNA_ID=CAMNT_0013115419 /DNA_START=144 /DNA_END=1487 /DNA_ORIENTATION=+
MMKEKEQKHSLDNGVASLTRSSSSSSLSLSSSSSAKSTADENSNGNSNSNGNGYLTSAARKNLKTYTYRGADMSLLYHYVLSPVAAFLVDTIIPKSMAPNTVTSIGLVWMISAYLSYWWYAPGLEFANDDDDDENSGVEFPPRWIFLWNGISVLAYQTLDNMDGKQARRTGSSSPLGLLFDHGCDAINSIFGSASVIIGMDLIPSENMFEVWLLIFGPFAMFYIATWEQYFTGELIMPIVNGPSEGLLGLALLSFAFYWMGTEFWQRTDIYDSLASLTKFNAVTEDVKLQNCDLFVIAVALCCFQEVILKFAAVTSKHKGSAQALLPIFVHSLCFLVIGWTDPNIWLDIPRTSLHLAMVLFVEMSTALMLAHVTNQSFNPWRWQVAPLIGITAWASVLGNSLALQNAIIVYTWGMGAYLVTKSIAVVREICDALQIWCFDIVTPYTR